MVIFLLALCKSLLKFSTGNDKGHIVLFEPSSAEHISVRTIYDPLTAIAPASDCSTFALGQVKSLIQPHMHSNQHHRYENGSILIATLDPTFTILHTLTTPRTPSPITGLAWHNTVAKQKMDMLATQTADGDLRVWGVSGAEQPKAIRVMDAPERSSGGRTWFAWSKNGRIIQFCNGCVQILFRIMVIR